MNNREFQQANPSMSQSDNVCVSATELEHVRSRNGPLN